MAAVDAFTGDYHFRRAKLRTADYLELLRVEVAEVDDTGVFTLPNGEATTVYDDAVNTLQFAEGRTFTEDEKLALAFQIGRIIGAAEEVDG